MAHSFLLFDFGSDEQSAQQARHKLESWKQAFRLGNKIILKFERKEAAEDERPSAAGEASASSSPARPKPPSRSQSPKSSKSETAVHDSAAASGSIRLLVRLDFSDHEKLSHQRWLDRIPSEDPFKSASPQIIRQGEDQFAATSELFDALD
jgi:hypothetical protein